MGVSFEILDLISGPEFMTTRSIEHLTRFKKKQAALLKEGKDIINDVVNETTQVVTKPGEKVHEWKHNILRGRGHDTRRSEQGGEEQ